MEVDTQILAVMSAIILAAQVIHNGPGGDAQADCAARMARLLLGSAMAATADNVKEGAK